MANDNFLELCFMYGGPGGGWEEGGLEKGLRLNKIDFV